ncbi:MAG: DUF4350 domain-containing protein [Candidatus Thiodiazotropha sp. (ex Ctena orbiculata)]|uniref:DUF4350 domain-containing protein n=1 Tax=Candidatus Thiodiazotropha taylori TaxID=2792791 RepID=A0A944M667_9GAMM|nr:DUF4350 domain-containing protein [Candidatus Thiodiazotropha taylori]PUB86643.1 MAG: hypothetical protein DBP00_11060 [gamma proteobacterium symbiont of Ctena orbiculata]
MKSNRATLAVLVTLLLLIGGLFAVWLVNNYEYVSEQVRGNMGIEARRNPLLAAERFLSRIGLSAESQTGRQYLIDPPPGPGLLLVRDLGPPLSKSRLTSLLAWVAHGGTLVVTPGSAMAEGSEHPLLRQFAVSVESEAFLEEEEPGSLSLPWSDRSLQIDFDTGRWFNVENEGSYWAAPDENYPNLVRFPWGEGSVTFLSDNDFLNNSRIGEKDHALLLAYLAGDADRAWLLYNTQMPSLLSYLWRHAPYLMISLALFGIAMIWRLQQSSGPLISPLERSQRNLLEHLQANADFAWRHNPTLGLLEATRREVERRWLASHPQLLQMDEKARCDWLQKQTGMTADSLQTALYSRKTETGQLIKTTTILQRLFSALHPERK